MGNEENNIMHESGNPARRKKQFINTSGRGESAQVPFAVRDKFNWGAFLLNWIWGLGNKTYITLIYLIVGLIPFVNLGVSIWFGIKGNEWAWKNKRFENIRSFHEIQKKWAIAGVILLFVIIPAIYFIMIFGFVAGITKTAIDNPEKTEQVMTKLENMMDNMASTYFETYTIDANENRFYVKDDDWKYMSFSNKRSLLDFAAQTAASKREKAYKEQNPDGHKYFSKMSELNRTKIYSANNKNSLLGEFYMDESLYEGDEFKFSEVLKASMKAYKFYNPGDNAQPVARNNNYISREEKADLKRAKSGLNQAITLNYALDKKYITNPNDFVNMFTRRLSVLSEKTTSNSFTTADNNKFTIIPLRQNCNASNAINEAGPNSACAKVTVNDKYVLYLYSNGAFPEYNSVEYKILENNI